MQNITINLGHRRQSSDRGSETSELDESASSNHEGLNTSGSSIDNTQTEIMRENERHCLELTKVSCLHPKIVDFTN